MPFVENGDSDTERGATVEAAAVGVVPVSVPVSVPVPVPVEVPPVCVAEKSAS